MDATSFLARLTVLLVVSAAPARAQDRVLVTGGDQFGPFAPHGDPHNVLLVVLDDVGTDMFACYGEGTDLPSTPTLDALAADGVVFRDAWASPLCSPTRALVQTGLHGYRNHVGALAQTTIPGAFLPLALTTLPELLEGSSMTVGFFGKWHLGDQEGSGFLLSPNLAGYDYYEGALIGLHGNYFEFVEVTNGEWDVVQNYSATEKVDDFLRWREEVPEPWFATLSFELAHAPYHAPPAHLHDVDLSGGDDRSYYEAMVQAADTELGRALDGLGKALGRTTVIVLGDNGTPSEVTAPPFSGAHAKGTLYEGGVRVPLVVSGRAVEAPGESRALVHAVDVFATVAELAGVDPATAVGEGEEPLDSLSLLPYLVDPNAPSQRAFNLAELFCPAGVGHGRVITLPPDHCQEELGYQGPGAVELSVCGGILSAPNHGDVSVTGAPPSTFGTAFFWLQPDPQPVVAFGGTLVGDPEAAWMAVPFAVDASGEFAQADFVSTTTTLGVQSCGGIPMPALDVGYLQVVIDTGVEYQVSNAVRLEYVPYNVKAVRSRTHKLIRHMNLANLPLGQSLDELYRLEDENGADADVFETTNLLDAPLSSADQAALGQLTLAFQAKFGTPTPSAPESPGFSGAPGLAAASGH